MTARINSHYTMERQTQRQLRDLKDKTRVPMNRLIDEAINLYHAVRLAKRPVICTPTATGIEISEVQETANHD